jgi:hypothetical protein
MSGTTNGDRLAREVTELAALVMGREPPETVERLRGLGERLAAGGKPERAEIALLERVRRRYGHELTELEHPDPW